MFKSMGENPQSVLVISENELICMNVNLAEVSKDFTDLRQIYSWQQNMFLQRPKNFDLTRSTIVYRRFGQILLLLGRKSLTRKFGRETRQWPDSH